MYMELQTQVSIAKATFEIAPCERMLFVGSCFADNIGRRFADDKFRVTVNPYGVMYNPVSIAHTVAKVVDEETKAADGYRVAVFTLGTNHVYILNSTGEVVDNCQKRPQKLFTERALSIAEVEESLTEAILTLRSRWPEVKVILTVSPIRYRKYGFHESQLSKSSLLLAADAVTKKMGNVYYFPAYEIMNDELRDYRFYREDMIHPSAQAVEYIWQRFADTYFGKATWEFLNDWKPIKEALAHRPFDPNGEAYKQFMDKTMLRIKALSEKYNNFAL